MFEVLEITCWEFLLMLLCNMLIGVAIAWWNLRRSISPIIDKVLDELEVELVQRLETRLPITKGDAPSRVIVDGGDFRSVVTVKDHDSLAAALIAAANGWYGQSFLSTHQLTAKEGRDNGEDQAGN